MKFINKVIVFVMGLVVIGVSTTTINVVTQSKNVEKSVTFDILTETTVTPGTFNSLIEFIGDVELNTKIDIGVFIYDTTYNENYIMVHTDFIEILFNDGDYIFIYDNDTWLQEDIQTIIVGVGDTVILTSNEVVETPFTVKALLALTPLILSASLIGFLAFKKGDE